MFFNEIKEKLYLTYAVYTRLSILKIGPTLKITNVFQRISRMVMYLACTSYWWEPATVGASFGL
jgi:hypothetical protein